MICTKCAQKTHITYDNLCEECELKERKNPKETKEDQKQKWERIHAHLLKTKRGN